MTRYGCEIDSIALTVPAGRRYAPIITLVVGGVGTRLDLPYERVDDLQLAVGSALEAAAGDEVWVEIDVHDHAVALRVGPLTPGVSADAGLRRVVDRLVDRVRALEREGTDWLEMEVRLPGRDTRS